MDTNQLIAAIAKAVRTADVPAEYCLLGNGEGWWSPCMTKGEWAGWLQAIGALVALAIAVGIPLVIRYLDRQEKKKAEWNLYDLTIRYHSDVLVTNEELIRVALEHLPGGSKAAWPDAGEQVAQCVARIRAVQFKDIVTIGVMDKKLATQLADFHCSLEKLRGVLDANPNLAQALVAKTSLHYITELDEIAKKMREHTVHSN